MIVNKTFNESSYILTNFSNSNNPVFTSKEEVDDFKRRLKEKLDGLVEILAWNFQTDHFQLLVYLKSREEFESFYRQKYKSPEIESEEIPASYLILSQEMANIQSGYAKWFNHRHNRYGGLFGRRYTKLFLETKEDVQLAVNNMNAGKKLWDFDKLWSYIWNFLKGKVEDLKILDTSKRMYDEKGTAINTWFPGFLRYSELDLRGRYTPVPALAHIY